MTEQGWVGWRRIAEEFMRGAPTKKGPCGTVVAATLKRLCAERGAGAVGEVVATGYTAKEFMPPTAAYWKARGKALAALDGAVRRALVAVNDPPHDEALGRWLKAGLPLIGIANRAPTPRRATFRRSLGQDRRALERGWRTLGASKHEAEDIVSAIMARKTLPGLL